MQASPLSANALASLYNTTKATARKWKSRSKTHNLSHCPHHLQAAITHQFIHPAASRAGIYRCFKRHGVNDLKNLIPKDENKQKVVKTFKDDESGYLHIDIKYLPNMPDEEARSYLFFAMAGRG